VSIELIDCSLEYLMSVDVRSVLNGNTWLK
jgi:hypothetical protein